MLLAGRWFRSSAMAGPWAFVASNALPDDFAKIPPTSRAGAVLSAVAGTQQSREAMIETTIPQTATIPLANGPQFTAKFDGAPQFVAIPGTALSYASNAAVPIIQTAPNAYYAAVAGVWFAASAATGPWSIATSVPASIYSIPPSSPVYAVTYMRIYGATADAVFAGYTPGYLGAVRTAAGTVVYGTGYNYTPWIGNVWYPAPATYGVAAAPVYNKYVGYTYGFAMGLATPSWTGPTRRPSSTTPATRRLPCCATASANVYRRYNAKANLNSANIGAGGVSGGKWTGSCPGAGRRQTTQRAALQRGATYAPNPRPSSGSLTRCRASTITTPGTDTATSIARATAAGSRTPAATSEQRAERHVVGRPGSAGARQLRRRGRELQHEQHHALLRRAQHG